jgi:ribosome-associated protein
MDAQEWSIHVGSVAASMLLTVLSGTSPLLPATVSWIYAQLFSRELQLIYSELQMKKVEIAKEPVELYKILKFEGLASSGGEAKHVIADGQVLVNGKTETRKRKKIVTGDVIEFDSERYSIHLKLEPSQES